MIPFIQNLTYKQKCRYALYAFLGLIIIIYFTNIKETLHLKRIQSELLLNNKSTVDPEKRYLDLSNYNQKMDAIIGSNISDNQNITEVIIEHINNYSANHNVKIQEYYSPLTFNTSTYNVQVNHFILEGNFKDLLRLTYLFETKYKVGRLISIEYEIETDRRTKENKLLSHIYLQNISIEDEK